MSLFPLVVSGRAVCSSAEYQKDVLVSHLDQSQVWSLSTLISLQSIFFENIMAACERDHDNSTAIDCNAQHLCSRSGCKRKKDWLRIYHSLLRVTQRRRYSQAVYNAWRVIKNNLTLFFGKSSQHWHTCSIGLVWNSWDLYVTCTHSNDIIAHFLT